MECIISIFIRARKIAKKWEFRHVCHSFRLSVCVSFSCPSLRPNWTSRLTLDGFLWNLILSIFKKSAEKMYISLKSNNNNGPFTWRTIYVYASMSLNYFYVVQKIKTHMLYSITSFRKSSRLWHNVERYNRAGWIIDDNIIQRMCFAWWITNVKDTHSEYVILIAFQQQQWLRECVSNSCYTYIACIVVPEIVLHV